jgi:alpha-L-fucosidase
MRNIIISLALIVSLSGAKAQTTYEDIKNHPVAQWWQDAKFGIFIHWGVYSVPSFADHDYAEWYWAHKGSGKAREFHQRVYGEDFEYYDFAEMFKAEFFDANQWAELFSKAGAKYVVLTAKHMEGFTLWPSKIANELHGRPWNSLETGPRRDIVRELSDAVVDQDMKMGLYFMLYEAMNPRYNENPQKFIEEYSIPQFKDLYRTYTPSIIWPDGSWQHNAAEYHSMELLRWLLDSMPNPTELVFNNRWGSDMYHVGHTTTEYTYMLDLGSLTGPWEECRGIGESFGYNRNETLNEYNTAQELILLLIDVVSNGGNLLLNVGPTADGRIPIFKQERLIEIGKWLDINGEAIYGTNRYKIPTQWSEGQRMDINPAHLDEPITDGIAERKYILENFNILRLTVKPLEGYAYKEVMFTQKDNTVYAITPTIPRNRLVIRDVVPGKNTKITLLGSDKPLKWRYRNNQLVVTVPAELALELPPQYAYTFKIEDIRE